MSFNQDVSILTKKFHVIWPDFVCLNLCSKHFEPGPTKIRGIWPAKLAEKNSKKTIRAEFFFKISSLELAFFIGKL